MTVIPVSYTHLDVYKRQPMKDKRGKVIYEPYRIKVLNTINFKKSMHYNPCLLYTSRCV